LKQSYNLLKINHLQIYKTDKPDKKRLLFWVSRVRISIGYSYINGNALTVNELYTRLINFFKFFLTGIVFFHRLVPRSSLKNQIDRFGYDTHSGSI
jgi:hypothetical protein